MFDCKFCGKKFTKVSTLSAHLCAVKKRFLDQDSIGSKLGFRVFQKVYEFNTSQKNPKTIEDFITSPHYLSFVKFGRYLVELNPIDCDQFVEFVIKNAIPIDKWRSEEVYTLYLSEFTKSEKPERAVERTILELEAWAREHKTEYTKFFEEVIPNEAVWLIRSGRISPWVLYLAQTSDKLFNRISSEQSHLIEKAINPAKWQTQFMLKKDDVKFIKEILKVAAL
jgi:hypothetical protein